MRTNENNSVMYNVDCNVERESQDLFITTKCFSEVLESFTCSFHEI
jgi:hypothetical protein